MISSSLSLKTIHQIIHPSATVKQSSRRPTRVDQHSETWPHPQQQRSNSHKEASQSTPASKRSPPVAQLRNHGWRVLAPWTNMRTLSSLPSSEESTQLRIWLSGCKLQMRMSCSKSLHWSVSCVTLLVTIKKMNFVTGRTYLEVWSLLEWKLTCYSLTKRCCYFP